MGVVNSIFAGVTILVLSIFMVGGGPRWIEAVPEDPAPRPRRADRATRCATCANAIGNYIGGALLQATIAAVCAFIVLTILGAPFAAPLALLVLFFDLIPVVGATIAAVLIAIVMLFVNFPVGLIVWVVYAIVFQQIENYLIQPQIQKRATKIEPFITLVAVLFGSTLFGVVGAILAIPTAATLQIVVREYVAYRRESRARPRRPRARPRDDSARGRRPVARARARARLTIRGRARGRAAGGLVVRAPTGGELEVAVVHRPEVRRLVAAEGQARAGRGLWMDGGAARGRGGDRPSLRARATSSAPPATATARAATSSSATSGCAPLGGDFEPSDEVDELRWATPRRGGRVARLRARPGAGRGAGP